MSARMLGAGALAAGGVAAMAGRVALRRLARPEGEPGDLIDVDGLPLHTLSRRGNGPTVVFENGLCCPCTVWGWVLPEIAGRYGYLAYDRPGNGWSADDGRRRSVRDLNGLAAGLLDRLDLPAPYVLVGHSIGGLAAMAFAAGRASDVAGLVLIDSSHPDQLARSSAQRDSMPMVGHAMGTLYWHTLLGRKPPHSAVADLDDLAPPLAARSLAVMRRPAPWRAALREVRAFDRWCDEVRAMTLPPALPIAVVTAGKTDVGDTRHNELQAELAAWSAVNRHVVIDDADHDDIVMRQDNARHVVSAIDWVVAQIMAGPREMRGV